MIDSRIYIKSLNATEAGESNTNDSYILIPKSFDARDFFGVSTGNKLFFEAVDPEDGINYSLRFEITSNNKEQRIYMLGVFCRKKGLHAGDTICIENLNVSDKQSYIIRYRKRNNIALLQKSKGDYLIERNDIGDSLFENSLKLDIKGQRIDLMLSFKGKGKKRNDSPDEFDFYEARVNETEKLTDYINDQYVIIDLDKMAIVQFEKAVEYRITQE